ncbi:MAG: hypothetical protein AAGI38_23250, partial [Bacteroidota bacterium]
EFGNISAKIQLAELLFDNQNESQGRQLMLEAFDFLYPQYKASKFRFSQDDYDDLITVLEFLEYDNILYEVKDSSSNIMANKKSANELYRKENLLKKKLKL